jgi:hypothetical protein
LYLAGAELRLSVSNDPAARIQQRAEETMSDPEVTMSDQAEPVDDGRNESPAQKMDRNWMELLQELRVLQTGVQLLAGFLLTLPFQDRFETLDTFQTTLYLVCVVLAALTTAMILLPVSVHRRLFRLRLKATLVSSADRIAKLALAGVALLTVATSALVFDVTAGRTAGLTAGASLLAVLLILLVYVPTRLRRQGRKGATP